MFSRQNIENVHYINVGGKTDKSSIHALEPFKARNLMINMKEGNSGLNMTDILEACLEIRGTSCFVVDS